MTKQVDICIPVYKPGEEFVRLLSGLTKQTVPIGKIRVVNTGKEYWDRFLVNHPAFSLPNNLEVTHITPAQYDHAGTRDYLARQCDTDVFVMMTQDAVPEGETLLECLTAPLYPEENKVAVSYGRQLPADYADPEEVYSRMFNYPAESRIKRKEDIPVLKIKACFCSNVCAAYRRDLYLKLGGFKAPAIFNEDMVFAAAVLEADYGIAYVAEARVIHSHHYSNRQQFSRNFDLGVSQAMHPEVFEKIPAESEGVRLVKSTAAYLCKTGHPLRVPGLVITSAYKYLGYRKGKNYKKLSREKILQYTMNRHFWEGQ